MATFTKFNRFALDVAQKKHDLGASGDTLKVALYNVAPAATKTDLADIGSQVSYTNASARTLNISASSQSSGTATVVIDAKNIAASGGTVGPFRYVVVYNDTASADNIIGFVDYGASITLADGESIDITFNAASITIQ
jgi:hypothetical protein